MINSQTMPHLKNLDVSNNLNDSKQNITNNSNANNISTFSQTKSMVFKILPTFKSSLNQNHDLNKSSIESQNENLASSRKHIKAFQLSPILKKGSRRGSMNMDRNNTRSNRLINSPDSNKDRVAFSVRLQTPYDQQVVFEDKKPKEIIGQNAVSKFYNHYKKLDKIKDQNVYKSNPDSVYTAFLNKTESLNLFPCKIGFIKYQGDENKLALSHFGIGDKYAQVLSEGLKSIGLVNSIELANNRLSSKGADAILSNLSKNVQVINLANNKIGYLGCGHISNLIMNKTNIYELNLEGNLLGDVALRSVLDALLTNNNIIRKLNLSRNYLTNNSADKIAKMIENNYTLDEFYLNWNQLNGAGGALIIKGMIAGKSRIKVLDLSWNAFGGVGSPFAKVFSEFIINNEDLIHLDLSNNNFTKEESKLISEALEKNQTLYGIHYDGNYGYIDPRGFLRLIDVPCEKLNINNVTHQIKGVLANYEFKKHTITELGQYKECCWICEGWKEVEFKWTPLKSGLANDDPIYLHLHHEGYRNIFLSSGDNFTQIRMCPPENITYFFTAQDIQVLADDQDTCHPNEQIINYLIDDNRFKIKFENLNVCVNNFNSALFDPITYTTTCLVKPRTPEKQYIPPEIKKERTPWSFPISIFREYKVDNEEIIRKCFEVDFENTRIPKFVKKPEELAVVKELLRGAYKNLKECYKYYASIAVVSDIWCIHQAEINEFCRHASIKDANFLDEKELGLLSIKTYTKGADSPFAKNHRNPDRALVRYQFLEFILRVAEECVVTKGLFKSYPEAVKIILDDKILNHAKTFDFHKFRIEKYWNEECDTVYKTYLPVVQSTYRRYSGMKTKPGQKKFMCLEELFKLVNDSQLLNDHLVDRDINVFFSISMMTQIDELMSDRIYQMSFLEFLECLARIADVYAAANIGENEAEIPYEIRYARPLHYKLEGLIAILFYRGVETIISENYILPEKSIFDWSIQEQQAAAKVIGKRRTIIMVDPVTKRNISALAE